MPLVDDCQCGYITKLKPKRRRKGVCYTVALPFTLKSILRKKEEYYESSNISPCKNKIFRKDPLKETKSFKIL